MEMFAFERSPRYPADRGRSKRFVTSHGLVDYYDVHYLGIIGIGTPRQNFLMMMDTGSSGIWVIDQSCNTATCNGNPRNGRSRSKYNPAWSYTFRFIARNFSTGYASGGVSGYEAEDSIHVGGVTVTGQRIGVATHVDNGWATSPIDGIFGLGWPIAGAVAAPMQNVINALDSPLFTIWMNRIIYPVSRGQSAGVITYGAVDNINCRPYWVYVPMTRPSMWEVPLQGFRIGSYSITGSYKVLVDSGSSRMGVPNSVLNAIVQQTSARWNNQHNGHTVNCATIRTQPIIHYSIEGIDYTLPSDQYVVDTNMGNNECLLAFYGTTGLGLYTEWILGMPWFRAYCNLFDFGNRRVGFSVAIPRDNELTRLLIC
ncbi:hypothetical protein Q1695_004666 [Nippostrongylus brasiliensis]|nr:hypothetical protein Q1695_004666 [Nippostrongylus brasiliensis]